MCPGCFVVPFSLLHVLSFFVNWLFLDFLMEIEIRKQRQKCCFNWKMIIIRYPYNYVHRKPWILVSDPCILLHLPYCMIIVCFHFEFIVSVWAFSVWWTLYYASFSFRYQVHNGVNEIMTKYTCRLANQSFKFLRGFRAGVL